MQDYVQHLEHHLRQIEAAMQGAEEQEGRRGKKDGEAGRR